MDSKRIRKLRTRIAKLRAKGNNIRTKELKSLATAVGRSVLNQGKHLTFGGGPAGTFPISIPDHSGTMNRFVAGNVLDCFEHDLDLIEESNKNVKGEAS
jgi:hypothetical protein